MYTVEEARRELKISGARIRLLISQGRILATKHGHVWAIHKLIILPPTKRAGGQHK